MVKLLNLFSQLSYCFAAQITFDFYIYWPQGPINHGQSIDVTGDDVMVESSYEYGFASTLAEDYLEADDTGNLIEVYFPDSSSVKATSGLYSAGFSNSTKISFWTVSGTVWTKQLDIFPNSLSWPGQTFHQFQLGPDNSGIIAGSGYALFCHDVSTLNCSLLDTDPLSVSTDLGFSSYVSSDWIVLGDPSADLVLVYSRETNQMSNPISLLPQNVTNINLALCPCDFGYSVAVEGQFLAIGMPGYNSNQGAVSVFYLTDENDWKHHCFFSGIGSSTAQFGYSLELFTIEYPLSSVTYTQLFIGVPSMVYSSLKQGQVYVYKLSTSSTGNYALADILRGFFVTSSSNHDLGKDVAYTGKILYSGAPLAIPSSSTSPGRFYVRGYCQPNYKLYTPDSSQSYKTDCAACDIGKYTNGGTATTCTTCATSGKPSTSSWTTAPGCTYYSCNSGYFGTLCLVCSEYKASDEGGSDQDLPDNAHWVDGSSVCEFECDDYFYLSYDELSCIEPQEPSIPQNVTLSVIGAGMINVSWVSEVFDEQSPLFYYRIRVKNWEVESFFVITVTEGDTNYELTSGSALVHRSIVVYGLKANTSYSVSIQAKDVIQWGNETIYSNPVATFEYPQSPSQVRSISGSAVSGGAIQASWTSPADSGGDNVTSYIASACTTWSSCESFASLAANDNLLEVSYNCSFLEPLHNGESKSVTIYRLLVNTPYYVKVQACTDNNCSVETVSTSTISPFPYITIPSSPKLLSTISATAESACMQWQAPADLGGGLSLAAYWLDFKVVGFKTASMSATTSSLDTLLAALWQVPSSSVLFYPSLNYSFELFNGTAPLLETPINCVSDLAASVNYSISLAGENQAGIGNKDSNAVVVFVDGLVSAPSVAGNVSCINSTSSAIRVKFVRPVLLGGSPMTGVRVYCGIVNQSALGDCNVSPVAKFAGHIELMVNNLMGERNYSIVAAGINSAGQGQNFTVQDLSHCYTLPATIPPKPEYITIVNSSASGISFHITPSGTGGSPILFYIVALTSNGIYRDRLAEFNLSFPYHATFSYGLHSEVVSMHGLQANTTYYLTASVGNEVGISEWSDYSETTTNSIATSPSQPRTLSSIDVSSLDLRSSDSVAISWKAPIDFGGSPISGFIVSLAPADKRSLDICRNFTIAKDLFDLGPRFVDGCNQTAVVVSAIDLDACIDCETNKTWSMSFSGLVCNASFQIMVRAVPESESILGESASIVVTTSTLDAPTAPRNLFVPFVTNSSAFMTWDVPRSDGGNFIYQFQIVLNGPAGTSTLSVSGSEKSIMMHNLLPNSSYQVYVVAVHTMIGMASDWVTFETSKSDSNVFYANGAYQFCLGANVDQYSAIASSNGEVLAHTNVSFSALSYVDSSSTLLHQCGSPSSMLIDTKISVFQQIMFLDVEENEVIDCGNTSGGNLHELVEFEDYVNVDYIVQTDGQWLVSDMSNLLLNTDISVVSKSIHHRLIRDTKYCIIWRATAWASIVSLTCSSNSYQQTQDYSCDSSISCSENFVGTSSSSCVCDESTLQSWSQKHGSLLKVTLPVNATLWHQDSTEFFRYEQPASFESISSGMSRLPLQSLGDGNYAVSEELFEFSQLNSFPNEILLIGSLFKAGSSYFAEVEWTEPVNINGEYFVDGYELEFGYFDGAVESFLFSYFSMAWANREVSLLSNVDYHSVGFAGFNQSSGFNLSSYSYRVEGVTPNVTYSVRIRSCLDGGSGNVDIYEGLDVSIAESIIDGSYPAYDFDLFCSDWSNKTLLSPVSGGISAPSLSSPYIYSSSSGSTATVTLEGSYSEFGGSSLMYDLRGDSSAKASAIILGTDCSSVDSMGIDAVEQDIRELLSAVPYYLWNNENAVFNDIWHEFSLNNFTLMSCSLVSYVGPLVNKTLSDAVVNAMFIDTATLFMDSGIKLGCNIRWLKSDSCFRFWNFVANSGGASALSMSTPPIVTLSASVPSDPEISLDNLNHHGIDARLDFGEFDGGSKLLKAEVQVAFIGSLRNMCEYASVSVWQQLGTMQIPDSCHEIVSIYGDNVTFQDMNYSVGGMWRDQSNLSWDVDYSDSIVTVSDEAADCLTEFSALNPSNDFADQVAEAYRQELFVNPSAGLLAFSSLVNLTVAYDGLNYYEYAWELAHEVNNSVMAVVDGIDDASVVLIRGRVMSTAHLWSDFSLSSIVTAPSSIPPTLDNPIIAVVSSVSAQIIIPNDIPENGNGGCDILNFGIEILRENPCQSSSDSDDCIQSLPFTEPEQLHQRIFINSSINSSCCNSSLSDASPFLVSVADLVVDGNGDLLDIPCIDADSGFTSGLFRGYEISISEKTGFLTFCKADVVSNFNACESPSLVTECNLNDGLSVSVLVTDLIRSSSYSVRSWAENDKGKSAWSSMRNFTTFAIIPDQPVIRNVYSAFGDRITVAFQVSDYGGAKLYGFQVAFIIGSHSSDMEDVTYLNTSIVNWWDGLRYFVPDETTELLEVSGFAEVFTKSADENWICNVTGLSIDTTYSFSIRAVTLFDYGSWSQLFIQKTRGPLSCTLSEDDEYSAEADDNVFPSFNGCGDGRGECDSVFGLCSCYSPYTGGHCDYLDGNGVFFGLQLSTIDFNEVEFVHNLAMLLETDDDRLFVLSIQSATLLANLQYLTTYTQNGQRSRKPFIDIHPSFAERLKSMQNIATTSNDVNSWARVVVLNANLSCTSNCEDPDVLVERLTSSLASGHRILHELTVIQVVITDSSDQYSEEPLFIATSCYERYECDDCLSSAVDCTWCDFSEDHGDNPACLYSDETAESCFGPIYTESSGGSSSCAVSDPAVRCSTYGCEECNEDEACGWCSTTGECAPLTEDAACGGRFDVGICFDSCSGTVELNSEKGVVMHGDRSSQIYIAPSQTCRWKIYPLESASQGNYDTIELKILHIHLGEEDSLSIYSSESEIETSLMLLVTGEDGSSEIGKTLNSNTGLFVLVFRSDSVQSYSTGFELSFKGIAPEFFNIYLITGIILSSMAGCVIFLCVCGRVMSGPLNRQLGDDAENEVEMIIPGLTAREFGLLQRYLAQNISGIVAKKASTSDDNEVQDPSAGCCCICMAEYSKNDEVMFLPCSHIFHVGCIENWLRSHRTCPLCKQDIRVLLTRPDALVPALVSEEEVVLVKRVHIEEENEDDNDDDEEEEEEEEVRVDGSRLFCSDKPKIDSDNDGIEMKQHRGVLVLHREWETAQL